jgi:hypothetical protein
VSSEASNALYLRAGVDLCVPSNAIAILLLTLAKVQSAGKLADDVEVGAAADIGLERRDIDKGVRGKVAWS